MPRLFVSISVKLCYDDGYRKKEYRSADIEPCGVNSGCLCGIIHTGESSEIQSAVRWLTVGVC